MLESYTLNYVKDNIKAEVKLFIETFPSSLSELKD